MSAVKDLKAAQEAKEKGNVAFRTSDFPIAIGHYSTAILADRDDYTLPLNRAAAYIKLGKYEDAEKDCTAALALNVSNVKALYRRGQARLALGKLYDARDDLMEALKSEPANNIVHEELKSLNSLLGKSKTKKSHPLPKSPAPDVAPIKRRRVPITIVNPTPPGSSISQASPPAIKSVSETVSQRLPLAEPAVDLLQPVSSRSLNPLLNVLPPSSPTPMSSVSTQVDETRTFRDAKQARESAKPSRVGGGIFRASGDSTIFPIKARTSPTPSTLPRSTTTDLTSKNGQTLPPLSTTNTQTSLTLFDFSKSWRIVSAPEDRWSLISTILPVNLPVLFGSSLEPSLLFEILQVFEGLLNNEDRRAVVREYMENFARVPRFGTVILFLSRKEKDLVKRVWERLGVGKDAYDPIWGACF